MQDSPLGAGGLPADSISAIETYKIFAKGHNLSGSFDKISFKTRKQMPIPLFFVRKTQYVIGRDAIEFT